MQPLSPRTRSRYLYTFIGLFFVMLPLVILYADGWRWNLEDGIYKTGGVFVTVPYQDADVVVGGVHIGRSSFFDRSFYVGNLAPDAYVVEVKRDGYISWNRVLVVEPQLVTDADALLIPTRIQPEVLMVSGIATTGVAVVTRAQYSAFYDAFATTTLSASTTLPQDQLDNVGLFVAEGAVVARWMGEDTLPSSRFCMRPSECVEEIPLARGDGAVATARFFRGGVAYATRAGGVFFSEIDVRPAPMSVLLFESPGADIRVVDDLLIIKTATALYQIDL